MKATWVISKNHLALRDGSHVYHPDANDVYSLINGKSQEIIPGVEVSMPSDDLPDIRFSKVGAPIKVVLTNSGNSDIEISILTTRRGITSQVDIVDGYIINQCVVNNTWFFLNGPVNELQEMLKAANITANGVISMRQYLKFLEQEFLKKTDIVINNVDGSQLKSTATSSENTPCTLKATLFPYQATGFQWLKSMLDDSKGCILGDEMGLGKTMQVITEMLYLKSTGQTPMLVIAPISLLTNWQRECAKFAPSLRTNVHYGPHRISNYKEFSQYDVVIAPYTAVVSDIHMLNMVKWQLVALDEAQNIKNPYSARAKACKATNRVRSLAVSGTPFENHVSDIWSLVDFVQPGLLGSLQSYQDAISDDVDGGKRIEPILSPLMIRRLVADVAQDLPEKVVSTQPLQMSEYECDEYNKYLEELKSTFNAESVNLGMLQKLRIFCSHPFAVNEFPAGEDPTEHSVKYQRFCEIVEEIISRNEKVIVFTSYKKMFDIFMKDIPNRFGIKIWAINGETPVENRQSIVDTFNNLDGSAMLVLNPRAAGTGLNITGANHVVHYNLEWNPSLEDQSSARAYRRGQQKTVFVYRLYYTDTIEQVVNERIERKRDIASSAIIGNDGTSQDRADIIRAMELIPSIRNN